jgi:hypothetical protein
MKKSPKYVSAAYLAERTSLTTRWFTGQACEGRIPGAVQPAGPGGAWRFDEAQFWVWWSERGRTPWYPSLGRMPRANSRDEIRAAEDSEDSLEKLLGLPPYDHPRGRKGRRPS